MKDMEKLQPKLRFPNFTDIWQMTSIKDICKLNPPSTILPDSFIYIDLESVNNGVLEKENQVKLTDAPSRARRLLKVGDVLFQMVRPYQKNNYHFNLSGDYVASTGYAQMRPEGNSEFLFQYLHTQKFVDKVIEKSTGSNYPAINSSDLSEIFVSFPTLPEQTKIASFLSTVDEKITGLKKQLSLLESYKKGVMQKIFSQELRFKDENGNEFPDWEEKKIKEIMDERNSQAPKSVNYPLMAFIAKKGVTGENGHVDHPKTEYVDQLFSFV
jgi:type I restriction enzyme S subunit